MINSGVMWNAVINNDAALDGQFFYGVKSTGIFCKPSCKSKAPLRSNIEYFVTASEALKAGFRPCKRCRPDLMDYQPLLEIADDVKRTIDTFHGDREQLMAQLASLGFSYHRLSEIFKEYYGLTPNQYADNLKIQSAKRQLENNTDPIIEIALSLGFDSLSAFYAFFRKHTQMTPKEYRVSAISNQATLNKYCASYDSMFGRLLISTDGEGITGIKISQISAPEVCNSPHRLTEMAATQLEEYFACKRQQFDLPIHPIGTVFQQRVWESLCSVPYGETRSYKQIAEAIGNPNASRAIGMANNKNPIIIVIPCHRIVSSNGDLIGYAAGLETKRKLLDLEQTGRWRL